MDPKDVAAIKPDCLAPAEVEQKAEAVGTVKANMSFRQNAFLSILAGMFIGMGGMFMLLVKADSSIPWIASQLLGGLVFCLGLFLVVAAGAELFTGNTLMTAGALSKKYSWGKVCKNWVIVWVFNFIGSLILVSILFFANYWAVGPAGTPNAIGVAMINVGLVKINQAWLVLMFKGIMCNFLVCLAVWIAYAGRTIIDKLAAVLLPISAFVACGFEHCVANMFFLPMAFVMKISGNIDTSGMANIDSLDIAGIFYNLSAATVGNIIGGAILVACVYWFAFHKKQNAA